MAEIEQEQNQDQDQEQEEPLQLTGDHLSEMHELAEQLQAANDPRAQRIWNFVQGQTEGGDANGVSQFTLSRSPSRMTSWLEDLENDLWGQEGSGDDDASQDAESNDVTDDQNAVVEPSIPELANVETPDEQQEQQPEPSGPRPVPSPSASTGSLEQQYGLGPQSPFAGYLKWRSENFRPAEGGGWEAPSGRFYSDQDLLTLYTGQQPKPAARPQSLTGASPSQQPKQRNIEDVAQEQVDSTDYEFDKAKGSFKAGKDKCNLGVADWIEQSGRPRPQVKYLGWRGLLGLTRDPSSHEWADPAVQIPGWSAPMPVSQVQSGDVIAQEHGDQGGHVGIVLAPGHTISVNSKTHPAGIVQNTEWGFRPRLPYGPDGLGGNGESRSDPDVVVRRYIGDQKVPFGGGGTGAW